jgi:hypothetical protein
MTTIEIPGGNYELRSQLVDSGGTVLLEQSTPITVSPRSSIPRPGFIYRRGFNTTVPGFLSLARGQQFLALGMLGEALAELKGAVSASKPQLPMARW